MFAKRHKGLRGNPTEIRLGAVAGGVERHAYGRVNRSCLWQSATVRGRIQWAPTKQEAAKCQTTTPPLPPRRGCANAADSPAKRCEKTARAPVMPRSFWANRSETRWL